MKNEELDPISALIKELDIESFSRKQFEEEKNELEEKFLKKGIKPDEIDSKIESLELSCMDPLVEEWVDLMALRPYLYDTETM